MQEKIYPNMDRTLTENEPFFKEFKKKYPHFYGKPLVEEAEGEAVLAAIHKEYKRQVGVQDPLAEITLNTVEDVFIAPGQNVMIHKIPLYVPAIMHYNDYFEVKFVNRGVCTYYTKEQTLQLKKGDIIITPPKVRQCFTIGKEDEVFNILIRSSTFETAFLNLVNQDNFLAEFFSRALYGSPADYILWHCGENSNMTKLVEQCYDEFYSEKPYKNRMVDVLVMQLFVELLREEIASGILPEISTPDKHETVRILINYLQNHCAKASLADVAAICNYSERQISRILKEEMGYSFTQLRQKIRLQKASVMMEKQGVELKEIAKVLGFGTESYFCKVFREEYGITPMEYRERRKK